MNRITLRSRIFSSQIDRSVLGERRLAETDDLSRRARTSTLLDAIEKDVAARLGDVEQADASYRPR